MIAKISNWRLKLWLSLCSTLLATTFCNAADKIVLVAGGGTNPATQLLEPFGVAFDSRQQLWIIEMASGNRLLELSPAEGLIHRAGRIKQGGLSGDGGPAIEALLNGPHNLAILPDDTILIADTWNGRIRSVDPKAATIQSVPGYDVPRDLARKSGPYCITLNPAGNLLYIADLLRVWSLDLKTNHLTVVAGNGEKGIPQDGAVAIQSPLVDPRAVAPDRHGNVYILERGGHALRVVDSQGKIRTLVNRSGTKGNSGDDGAGINATLNGPKHLTVDPMDRVVIADAENNVIRRYDPKTGIIERIAGTGTLGSAGLDGAPKDCQLARPHGVTFHPTTGELYITDSYNNRILRITSK